METSRPATKDNNFRLLLQRELVQRCQKNRSYSLRAFARSLKVSSSALSAMLSGKRKITPASVEKLGFALGLTPKEINRYRLIMSFDENTKPSESDEYQQIALDAFSIIADWYHYAILELIRVKTFVPNTTWIAKSLGITKSEANIAVERLVRTGLLEISGKKWIDKSANGNATNISGQLTSAASRMLQKQVLEKSIASLEQDSVDVRNHTSLTLAMNPEDLPMAVQKIRLFRRELVELLEANRNPTEVYHVNVSIYPVTSLRKRVSS